MMKRIPFPATMLATAVAAMVLSACGGSDSAQSGSNAAPASVSGVFLDAEVEGLDYETASVKDSTKADGGFSCKSGETVSFSAGGIKLGSAACGQVITPLELAKSATPKDETVINRLLALQTLDEDQDPSNGIRITSAVKTALNAQALDFNAKPDDFHAALNKVLNGLPAGYQGRSVDAERRNMARNILKTRWQVKQAVRSQTVYANQWRRRCDCECHALSGQSRREIMCPMKVQTLESKQISERLFTGLRFRSGI
jgi:hypothetical protein